MRQLLLLCLAALTALSLACSGGGPETTALPDEQLPSALTSTATPAPVRLSGIPAVDRIVSLASAQDAAGLGNELVVHQIPCILAHGPTAQFPAPPVCAVSEPAGTPVDSVQSGGCQSGWMRAADKRAVGVFPAWPATLYAAAEDLRDPGHYLLIFSDPTSTKTLLVMTVSSAGIEDTGGGCGNSPRDQAAPGYLRFVIPPPP